MAATIDGRRFRGGIAVAMVALGIAGGGAWLTVSKTQPPAPGVQSRVQAVVPTIAALGRLEPAGEVIALAPPVLGGEPARIARLLVDEGSRVERGQVVAVLDRQERLRADQRIAREQVAIARARLAQVQAGAKTGDLAAQRATIARLSSELQIAESEYDRFHALFSEGAISESYLDGKRLSVETLRGQLAAAREQLVALAEVRPTDVRLAAAQVASAEAALAQVNIDLERSLVRSPLAGQVLKVHARDGELVSSAGIAELGRTSEMEAVAEVYEDDLARVHPGRRAQVRSVNRAFAGVLHGTVVRVVPRIGKKDVLATDPAADVDARVAEVRIRLNRRDALRVSGLTNLKIQVEIES